MKLAEALQTINRAESYSGTPFRVVLACGFTPLHLETFLRAYLQLSLSGRRVQISGGLYGDLVGTLERNAPDGTLAVAVALEWADLDARLGYRSLGGWGPREEAEIVKNVRAMLQRLQSAIEHLSSSVQIALSLPSLPLPPAFHAPGGEAGIAELEIAAALSGFAAKLARCPGVSVVNTQRLLEQSPVGQRLDLKAELFSGHPYTMSHADALGAALARLVQPAQPKKGLITDLDDTLWSGIVGEVGADAVAWDLDQHAVIHGLYQQTLAALAGQGVLLAVASKNNPEVVEQALARRDLRLGKDNLFPVEAHWQPKSESVGRILKTWNIAADSVVFVDDSPIELAEVKAAWPEIECLQFPKDNYAAALALFRKLRDLTGKSRLANEDKLRLASMRGAATFSQPYSSEQQRETFLEQTRAVCIAQLNPPPTDLRIIELVNKTNQFNLNGVRHTEAEWRRMFDAEGSFLVAVSYEDKYGPLGKIAVLAGRRENSALRIHTWVMSCRAFSRRIEYACMDLLLSKFDVNELQFDLAVTPKNAPCRASFEPFLGFAPKEPFTISRERFEGCCPRLYYKVETIL